MKRVTIYLLCSLAAAAVLLRATIDLPHFGGYRGPYGDVVTSTVIDRINTPQAVTAVMFDYRGFDTLGEEFILFTAVAGALLLMRRMHEERSDQGADQEMARKVPPTNDALHVAGMVMFPVTLLLGISMILHGHLTPGGGFQGGVIVATAFYFIYLSGEFKDLEKFTPDHVLDLLEASGAVVFALLAVLPLLMGGEVMTNIFPEGTYGELASAGTLPVFNAAVGIEVAAAFILLVAAFLKQAIVVRRGGRK